ncbi:MAG: DUF1207 domain-containing protein [Gemmatimonadota bacterium]|nr:DUF1207 domain-containing protein [Gemmatimonadota bacterium]
MSSIRALLALGVTVQLGSIPGAAQERFFPAVRSFELPEASPRVYGVVGRLLSTRRGESRFGNEREAEAVLGENVPLVAIKRGPRPVVLGIGSQVYGRFSLDDSKTALISVDWVAGLNATALLGALAVTVEAYHESSHLGDEYGDRFQTQRLDWSREVVAGWATYGAGRWRVTGGLSYVLYDGLSLPKAGGALGLDFGGGRHQILTRAVEPVMGLYVEAAAATRWRLSNSAKLGLAFRRGEGTRRVGIALIAHDGLSTQRQFFRQESQYLGLEVRFDL